jgi:AAA-like domain/CHAT domain
MTSSVDFVKKILILTANPRNADGLRLGEEVRKIQAALERSRRRDQFEVASRSALRTEDLRRSLLDLKPQIVHFSGHGVGNEGLVLEDDAGQAQIVSSDALAQLFGLCKNSFSLECVLLNACYSEAQAIAIHQHIDCVIGMNQAIDDHGAIEFSVGFYDGLGAGRSYQDAFKFGCNAINLNRDPEEGIPKEETPVLKYRDQTSPKSLVQDQQTNPVDLELELTEGTMSPESRFYVERPGDGVALATIRQQGVTLTIKGPRQMGKSSMLIRAIDAAMKVGKKVAYLDFQLFEKNVLSDAEVFYRQFCIKLTEELKLPNRRDDFCQSGGGNTQGCTTYMKDYVLPELGSPLLLAMDEVDRIFDADFRSDFFGMLRSWHNNRAWPSTSIWKQFDLALVTATEPYHLIANLNQSPFNVGEVILLSDFTLEQVAELNQRHGSPLARGQVPQLNELLHGHPYLVRRALYVLASQQLGFEELLSQAKQEQGPFGNHLRFLLLSIYGNQGLVQGLIQVMQNNTCTDERIKRLLMTAGLIRQEGQRLVPRCPLYMNYFQEHL